MTIPLSSTKQSFPSIDDIEEVFFWLSKQEKNFSLFGETIGKPQSKREKSIQIITNKRASLTKDSQDSIHLGFLLSKVESILPNGEDLRGLKTEIFGYVLGREQARKEVNSDILAFGSLIQLNDHDVFVIQGLQSVIITNVDPEKRVFILKRIIEQLINDSTVEENLKEIIRLGADSGIILTLSRAETQKALHIAQATKESFLRFHNDVFNKNFDAENYPCSSRLEELVHMDTSDSCALLSKLKPIYIEEKNTRQEEPKWKTRFETKGKMNFDIFGATIGRKKQNALKNIELRRKVAKLDIELLMQVSSFFEKNPADLSQELLQKMKLDIFTNFSSRKALQEGMAKEEELFPSLGTILQFDQHKILIVEQAFFVLVTNVDSNETNLLRDLLAYVKQADFLSEDTKKVFQLCYEEGLILTLQCWG